MSKSYETELLNVYLNVFRDILYAYPNLESELEKDWRRLTRLLIQRGLPFLAVDLPALGKHLDRCIAENQYKVSGLPGSNRVSGTVPIPKLFRGLYLLVFESDGRLKELPDVQALFFLRQVLYLAKKLPIQCSDEAVRNEVADFLKTDRLLPTPRALWAQSVVQDVELQDAFQGFAKDTHYSTKEVGTSDGELLRVLDLVAGILSSTLGLYDPLEWNFRHGPGVVSNVKTGENRYRFVSWSERLESVFHFADCGFHSHRSWAADTSTSQLTSDEPVGRLMDVPKTLTKPRLIASEPSEHMWCQQNIWHFMSTRVERSWIKSFVNFHDQTNNQDLCIRGSKDGSLATVDLSAASDHVSCRCVGQFFRGNLSLLRALHASRTRFVRQRQLRNEPELVELRKYSTMGNATTFPVETLIFLGAALAAALVADGHKTVTIRRLEDYIGRVSVFGDDIVVPKESLGTLVRLLEVLDFKVNTSKTFGTGLFRESCGIDCFAGQTITPAYYHGPYEGTPESYARTVDVSNNFYQRLMVFTSEYLRSTVHRFKTPMVPIGSGYAGWWSFLHPLECHRTNKSRWNKGLHRIEYLVPCLLAVSKRTPISNESALLQFFTERPEPHEMWESGVASRPRLKLKTRWVPEWSLYGSSSSTVVGIPGSPKRFSSFTASRGLNA